jgi:hypothetical protein
MTVPAPSVESAAKYRVLGEWHALRQEWRDAAERLGVLVEVDRVDGWETITLDYFKLSLALIEAGKRDDFNRFREEFVAHAIRPMLAAIGSSNLSSCAAPRPAGVSTVCTPQHHEQPVYIAALVRYRWNCWSQQEIPKQLLCANLATRKECAMTTTAH